MNRMSAMKLCLVVTVAALLSLVSATGQAHANSKYAALVIHADTGDILFDRYSTQRRYPASLTKMMTIYMLLEKLEAGELDLDSKLKVSRNAASMPASKLGVTSGSTISVEDALHALIVKSANDVAVVVAEEIGGSESNFATMMTNKAWGMGMRSTTFRNASGLPNSRQVTTARDMAILSQRVIQDFPQYYHFFAEQEFEWDGKTIKGHNKLVGDFEGADGLKTGYTRMSGYNLATTTTRDGERLIGIVLGGRSSYTRNAHMEEILDDAYDAIEDKPTLLAAMHRVRPAPNLKPTTLAALGGSWPKENAGDTLATLAAANDNDTENTQALKDTIQQVAAAGDWAVDDDVSELIVSNDDETRLASRTDGVIGEGDIDLDSLPPERRWTIQTGAYRDAELASSEMNGTKTVVADVSPVAINEISETMSAGRKIYRIRFNGLTEEEARTACEAVIDDGGDCFTLRDPKVSDS